MSYKPNDPKGAIGATKTPLGLVPASAMAETAWVHRLGSEKYGPFNWRKTGVCATTYINAILRHLNAWRDGEDNDPESGRSHIAHVACCCNIILDAAHCGTLDDDRDKVIVQDAKESSPARTPEKTPTTMGYPKCPKCGEMMEPHFTLGWFCENCCGPDQNY